MNAPEKPDPPDDLDPARLRERREALESILNSLSAHVAVLDQDGRIIEVNDAWARFGRENGDPPAPSISVDASYLDVCGRATGLNAAEAHQAFAGIQAVLEGQSSRFEMSYPCHSPTRRQWFLMTVRPRTGPHHGAVVMHTDITHEVQLRLALHDSEERYCRLYENAQVGLFRSSLAEGLLLDGNQRLAELFGFDDPEPLRGLAKTTSFYANPEDRREVVQTLKERGEIRHHELRMIRRDGTPIWVRFSARLVPEEGCIEGVLVDVTVEKRAQQALVECERHMAMGALAARMAHEIEGPLSDLRDALQAGAPDVPRADIHRAQGQVERLTRILQLVRKAYFPPDLSAQPFLLADAVQDALRAVEPQARQRDITLRLDRAPEPIRAALPRQAVAQVLASLLRNAVDASSAGQVVCVRARAGGGRFRILVADGGRGIPQAIRDQVFEPFVGEHPPQPSRSDGLGLGLAVSQGLAGAMGGRLRFHSRAGKGTAFQLSVPLPTE